MCIIRSRGFSVTSHARTHPSAPAERTHVSFAIATAVTPPACADEMLPIFSPSSTDHTARDPSTEPETTNAPSSDTAKHDTAPLCDPKRKTTLPFSSALSGNVLYSKFGEPLCAMRTAPFCPGTSSNCLHDRDTGSNLPPLPSECSWYLSTPVPLLPPTRIERRTPPRSTAHACFLSFGSSRARSMRLTPTAPSGFSVTMPPRRPAVDAASSTRVAPSSGRGSFTSHV